MKLSTDSIHIHLFLNTNQMDYQRILPTYLVLVAPVGT